MAAFAISRIRFKAKNLLFSYFIMGLTIPPFVTLIPLYVMFSKMGLLDTHMALVLVYIAFNLPISILLFVNFINIYRKNYQKRQYWMDAVSMVYISEYLCHCPRIPFDRTFYELYRSME